MRRLLIYSLTIAIIVCSLGFLAILPVNASSIVDGDVIKTATSNAIYYVSGGKKMLMVNRGTYSSWSSAIGDQYDNFATLKVVSQDVFKSLPFGPNLTVRPGIGLIKFTDSNDFFAVGLGNKLYKLYNDNIKNVLYPNAIIVSINEGFKVNYHDNGNPVSVLTANSNYPDGTLIRQPNQSAVYLIENGQRRFMSLDVFNNNRFRNQWVIDTEVSKISPR